MDENDNSRDERVYDCPWISNQPETVESSDDLPEVGAEIVNPVPSQREDYVGRGRRRLKKGAIPSKFPWNNFNPSQSVCERSRPGVGLREEEDSVETAEGQGWLSAMADHDYALPPKADAEEETQRLESEQQLPPAEVTPPLKQPQCHRFCASDSDFRVYTRFPSEQVFMAFWDALQPSASRLVSWTKAQGPALQHQLPLIDECFLFLCRVAAGLKEEALASIFDVSVSTVSRVVIVWANYLFQVLGAEPVWMTRAQVQATMPHTFRRLCPAVRVIVDCAAVRCERPASPTLPSQTWSSKSNTLKGVVGVAPCGVVTFVSKLFTGSMSDKELTMRCGLLPLLSCGDGVVAHEGFVAEEELAQTGAHLILPPLKSTSRLSAAEAHKTRAMAGLRAQVQRALRRVKQYHIWDSVVPLSLSGTINQLWAVCCLLTHYQGPAETHTDTPQ
uniref:Transposase n=1 Tax=Knipowitschia caucasica TaxID=637954 RepID=A0AAV2M1U2_KNICA